jgi:hypothetical protein
MQLVDGGRIFNSWNLRLGLNFKRQGSILEEALYRFGNDQWSAATL